jgi:hypothetical protein
VGSDRLFRYKGHKAGNIWGWFVSFDLDAYLHSTSLNKFVWGDARCGLDLSPKSLLARWITG